MHRINFVMEQHLGHKTYYENIRNVVDREPAIEANWIPVTYTKRNGWIEQIGLLPENIRGTLRGIQQVRSALRRDSADVFFFNTQVPAALAGGLVNKRPYIIATDLTPLQYDAMGELYDHAPDSSSLLKAYKHQVNRTIYRRAARLLPWSSWTGDSLMNDYGVDPSHVEVLPPGVDLELWHPSFATHEVRPLRILFVGGDFERKGGPMLMRAFQLLQPGQAELHLITRSKVPPSQGVKVHNGLQPNSPELIALFQQSDLFVLPTGAEAFGIAAVEACATGLPVIATRTGGLNDIVDHGETGYFIPPDDGAALLSIIQTLAANSELRGKLSRAARAKAIAQFDARKNSLRLLECLAETATD